MSTRRSAPPRDLGSSPRPCRDLIGRLAGVPHLRGAVSVTARRRRDPRSTGLRRVSSGSRGPEVRAEKLLEPAGAGLAPARRMRHGHRGFRLAGWFASASAGFRSALLGSARPRPSPARLDSALLGSALSGPAIAPIGLLEAAAGPVPLRVPEATASRAGTVSGLCFDGGWLVTRLRVLVLVPIRSTSYGKPPCRCLK